MTGPIGDWKIHGYCGLCIARCGTVATIEGGRFTRLDPDPGHPTGQAICAKGRAAPELVYHNAADRWPEAVDVATLARYASALANGAVELAQQQG